MQTGVSTPSLRRRWTTLTPVEPRHHHVEDDHRRRPLRDGAQRLVAVGGGGHVEALEAQRALEGLTDGGLVVDDEDERFATDHASHDGRERR